MRRQAVRVRGEAAAAPASARPGGRTAPARSAAGAEPAPPPPFATFILAICVCVGGVFMFHVGCRKQRQAKPLQRSCPAVRGLGPGPSGAAAGETARNTGGNKTCLRWWDKGGLLEALQWRQSDMIRFKHSHSYRNLTLTS